MQFGLTWSDVLQQDAQYAEFLQHQEQREAEKRQAMAEEQIQRDGLLAAETQREDAKRHLETESQVREYFFNDAVGPVRPQLKKVTARDPTLN